MSLVFLLLFPPAGMGQGSSRADPPPGVLNNGAAPPISPEEKALFDQAASAAASGNAEAALPSFEQFVLRFPDSVLLPDVYLALGQLYSKRGEMKRAIDALKTILDRFPKHPRADTARLQLSDFYLMLGDLRETMDLWVDLPERESSKMLIYEQVAQAYLDRNEFLEALRVLMKKKELIVDPIASSAVREAIISILKEKLPEKELQTILKEYGSAFPSDEAMVRLIGIYDSRGDYYREEREIKRFLSAFPNHLFAGEAGRLIGQIREKIKAHRFLLGVALPLSGRLAPFGNNALNGVQLALQQFKEALPGASVGLVVRDLDEDGSRSQPSLAEWIDEFRPIALVGPLLSKEVDRIAPVAEKADLVLITPAATAARLPSLGKSVFRNAITARFQCHSIAEYAVTQMNLRRFAVLFPKEGLGAEWVRCFSEAVSRLGGEIVHAEPYPIDATDFTATIRQLKEADLKKDGIVEIVQEGKRKKEVSYTPGFDAIFLPGDAGKAGLMIPQLAFHNIKDIPLLGTSGWNTPEFLKLVGPYAEGATFIDGFFVGSPDPMVRKFVGQYRAKFQQEPDLFAAQAFDAARLVLAALEGGALTSRDVKAALANTKDFQGVSGLVSEIRDGEVLKKPILIQVQRGKLVQVN
ncbi:MAG: penicillin-binding protein activator [Candidatus Manganitrophus sp.]|nr:penicillin-binding protein activator [Candidatus Manganitrophus sp.]WDT71661.1 MAG: penicillin-binding protein activator [Candidatus Manganitrophus sp.]WDT80986.1 MAG: penicillin-binding protein activator [Candidatus Manganitrophus sp.]